MATTTKLAAPPPDDEPTGAAPSLPPTENASTTTTVTAGEWFNWQYNGPDGRIYSNIPVTVTNGAIIHWHTNPGLGDGCWTTTTNPPNTKPDNWRPEPTDDEAAKLRGDNTKPPQEG